MASSQRDDAFYAGYKNQLQGADLDRYSTLLQLTNGLDPFQLNWKSLSEDLDLLPDTNMIHIMHYLVYAVKSHTMVQMKAYKATRAYANFNEGWVQAIRCHPVNNEKVLVLGKVKHSQRLSMAPAKSWVLMEKDGTILAGWCSCIAGAGEACSHVGAVCYAVEYGARKKEARACTSRPNAWLPPALRDVPYVPIHDYDFTTPANKRKRMLREADGLAPEPDEVIERRREPNEKEREMILTPEQLAEFLGKVKVSDPNCAALRVSTEHSETPVREDADLPPSFLTFYKEEYSTLSYEDLVKEAVKKYEEISITPEQSNRIRLTTVHQSKSATWFRMRAGKLNAYMIHDILVTNIDMPSITTIKKACYPLETRFHSFWAERGKALEEPAREAYTIKMRETHANFRIKQAGYFNIPQLPCHGMSPDALTECDCCGRGLAEIKTRKRDTNDLEPRHMAQMQQQMLIISTFCNMKDIYCDYVIYREDQPLYIQRVYPDETLQTRIKEEGKLRMIRLILPELLGKYFSSLKSLLNTTSTSVEVCYCRGPYRLPLAKCSHGLCTFTYFHLACVGISVNRKSWDGWLCPECAYHNSI